MNKVLLFALASLLTITGFSQRYEKRLKAVSLYDEQTFYLNGGTRAAFGGKSRAAYKIELPKNTVTWYYSVTVTQKENNPGPINLLSQLTRILDQTGVTAVATNAILTPTGSGVCDAYLIGNNYIQSFLAKGEFSYDMNNSRENYRNGTIKIDMKPHYVRDFYIGFKNPSLSQGVTINFSAVALVDETVWVNN
jgi:hypothetical protein